MTLATLPSLDRSRVRPCAQDKGWDLAVLALLLGAVALARFGALWLSPSELGFDEAQYWVWSRDFAFGYFTKPPLIAWAIALEARACGDTAACVRSLSPLLHGATGFVLALLARRLYGRAAGFWTGVFYVLMPGVALSSVLMTTDVFLLLFWSVALLALFSHLERPRLASALGFGLCVGLGLNAKYAMIYLPVLVLFLALFDRPARAALLRRESAVAIAIAALLIAPNVFWNMSHSFATFGHTGENIGWSLDRLNGRKSLEFLGAQFGVAGPVLFGAMLNALLLGARSETPANDRRLLWLSWPILLAIAAQGFFGQANANWGAVAYPAGVILATVLVIRHAGRFFFVANLAICGTVSAILLVGTAVVDPATASGPARQLRQLAGWSQTGANLSALARERHARRIVVRGRALAAGLIHALRNERGLSVQALLPEGEAPSDQFQLDRPWRPGDGTAEALFVGLDADGAQALGLAETARIVAPIYSERSGGMAVFAAQGEQPDRSSKF